MFDKNNNRTLLPQTQRKLHSLHVFLQRKMHREKEKKFSVCRTRDDSMIDDV